VQVSCDDARWTISMGQHDADGFGGYADVEHVTSSRGARSEALNEQLLAFHALVAAGDTTVLRGR
jgi:hypothetical protein